MITPSFNLTATERVLPKLALDFTTAALDPRITFTRSAATATRTNSSGYIETVAADTPRFDYSPVTLVCKGLLIEEQRANLLLYSANFANAAWGKVAASVVANAIMAPSGTVVGTKLVEDTATNIHRLEIPQSPLAVSSNTAFTFSIYAKAGERTFIRLYDDSDSSSWSAFFNLISGTVGTLGSASSASISPAGNGWFRCSLSYTTTATFFRGRIALANANGSSSYTGDGTSGAYLYGAQFEAGAFATSYIPTTTTALTRNADVATITGTNFSDFWQASKGGAQVQALPSTVSGIRPLVQYDDGTANNIIALRGNTTNPELYVVDSGTPQARLDAGAIAANTAYNLTGWWATNDCKARKDSGAVVIDDTATIPTVTQARLGSDGMNYLNGHLASISYYENFTGIGSYIYTRRKNKAVFSLL